MFGSGDCASWRGVLLVGGDRFGSAGCEVGGCVVRLLLVLREILLCEDGL